MSVCEPSDWPGGIQETPPHYAAVSYGREAVLGQVANGSAVLLEDVVRWLRMRAEAETTTGARLTLMAAAQALEEAR